MALIEMFQHEPTDGNKRALRAVLDEGLRAAEGVGGATFFGADDLRMYLSQGIERPDFLETVSGKMAAEYEEWLQEHRSRVDAVLEKARNRKSKQ